MTQDSVLKLLKKKKKWMTSKEVATCLKTGQGSTSACLRKLFKQGAVVRKNPLHSKRLFSGVGGYYSYLWRIK